MHLRRYEYSRWCKSTFYKEKNLFIEDLCKDLSVQAKEKQAAKYVRMDNSGENKKFVERVERAEWKLTPA